MVIPVVPKDDPIGYSPLELLPTDADAQSSAVGQSSLRGSILSCGVKTATSRYDLPAPQVAVRNLVGANSWLAYPIDSM